MRKMLWVLLLAVIFCMFGSIGFAGESDKLPPEVIALCPPGAIMTEGHYHPDAAQKIMLEGIILAEAPNPAGFKPEKAWFDIRLAAYNAAAPFVGKFMANNLHLEVEERIAEMDDAMPNFQPDIIGAGALTRGNIQEAKTTYGKVWYVPVTFQPIAAVEEGKKTETPPPQKYFCCRGIGQVGNNTFQISIDYVPTKEDADRYLNHIIGKIKLVNAEKLLK